MKSLPPDGGFLGLLKVTTDKIAEECGMPVGPAVGSFPIHTTHSSIASYYQAVEDGETESEEGYREKTTKYSAEKLC